MNNIKRVKPLDLYDKVLKKLRPGVLQTILTDHELLLDGWKIYFVVDHFDISQYCFPVKVNDIGDYPEEKIDNISEKQHACHELFNEMEFKPILLKEYLDEMKGLINYTERFANKVFSKSDIINSYISASKLDEVQLPEIDNHDKLIGFLKDNFSNVLAITLGLHSIGAERLRKVYQQNSYHNRLSTVHGKLVDFDELEKKRENRLVGQSIYDLLLNYQQNKKERNVSYRNKYDKEKAEANNKRDARAISYIFRLNSLLNPKKILILYYSTAKKSKYLFSQKELIPYFPVIDNAPFRLLRTHDHIYAYVIRKGEGNNNEITTGNIRESLDIITQVIEIKQKSGFIDSECTLCAGGDLSAYESCQYIAICNGLQSLGDAIQEGKREWDNIRLVRRLNDFLRTEKLKKAGAGLKQYQHFINFVRELNQDDIRKTIDREVETIYNMLHLRCLFASNVPFSNESIGKIGEHVTNILQEFPICLKLNSPRLVAILKNAETYILSDKNERVNNLHFLLDAYGAYLEIDSEFKTDVECELLRCYLLFVLHNDALTKKAYDIVDNLQSPDNPYDTEIKYLMAFITRHLKRFSDCNKLCTDTIERYPDDPRFYHIRATNSYKWLQVDMERKRDEVHEVHEVHEKHKKHDPVPHDPETMLRGAIKDTKAALDRFDSDKKNMIIVNRNNLAYLYARAAKYSPNYIRPAREYIKKLTDICPREKWDPRYPEFYNTNATVLWHDYLFGRIRRDSIEKLKTALKYSKRAYEIRPKPSYKKLTDTIKEALSDYPGHQPQNDGV